jgi:hypothetical protein
MQQCRLPLVILVSHLGLRRVYIICTVIISDPVLSWSSCRHDRCSTMRARWRHQTRWPPSLLASMTGAGSGREAQSGRSTLRCWPQHGRARCQVHHQCGRRQWKDSSSGRGSRGRVAVPSSCRMRKTRGARHWERPGERGVCGRPLQRDCE